MCIILSYQNILKCMMLMHVRRTKMKTTKKIIAILLCALSIFSCSTLLFSCAKQTDNTQGRVYYLNFKPEQNEAWLKLAKTYKEKTGVEVTVLTAASGEYEATLTSEISKKNAPTLFQVNGPVGLANWSDYCLDLSDSKVYSELTSEEFALSEDDKVLGIAYVIESYGIIYNKTLLDRYFSSDFSSVKNISDINSFENHVRDKSNQHLLKTKHPRIFQIPLYSLSIYSVFSYF